MKKLVKESLLNEYDEVISDTTLYDMLQELQTWFKVDKEDLLKAKLSGINMKNNDEFADLVYAWRDGIYDEDPDSLLNELLNML